MLASAKPVEWLGSSKKDVQRFPKGARQIIGRALYAAQLGELSPAAKPMKGFGGAKVVEIVAPFAGNAFRAVYTVEIAARIYVLHCFQKKSKSGTATPQADLDIINTRLKEIKRTAP